MKPFKGHWYFVLIFSIFTHLQRGDSEYTNPFYRKVQLKNESGHRLEVLWVRPSDGETVTMISPYISNGGFISLNSFVNHTFIVREIPAGESNVCGSKSLASGACKVASFKVSEQHDQVVVVGEDLTIAPQSQKNEDDEKMNSYGEIIVEKKSRDLDIVNNEVTEDELEFISLCRDKARVAVPSPTTPETATKAIDELVSCMQTYVAEKITESTAEISYQEGLRTGLGSMLEDYACADENFSYPEPIETRSWTHEGVSRKVDVMHERKHSKIHILRNFISPEECEAVEEAAERLLHVATVADGAGGSKLSDHRKAMQAGIKVPWELEKEGHPIAVLSRRVYDYTNLVTGFNLKEHGQEDLMSIQYFGRGEDDEEPDRYRPHCDGDCAGMPHKDGQRMATMVMYCTVPEKGGATNFRNAGVKVAPEKGSAAFFSYIGPDKIMDKAFTEHSGCPVYLGEKKIVVQWMRLGVDSENPWTSWNTLGVKCDEDED